MKAIHWQLHHSTVHMYMILVPVYCNSQDTTLELEQAIHAIQYTWVDPKGR